MSVVPEGELLFYTSAKRQNTNVEFISKVLCVYFGSLLIVHHLIALKYKGGKLVSLSSTRGLLKSATIWIHFIFYESVACVSTGRFFIVEAKTHQMSAGALNNTSVQPLLPNCRSTEVSNSNQKHKVFSVQGGTVLWFGRKFKGCLCKTGDNLGILAGWIHTQTHTQTHFHALPHLTRALFPWLFELQLSSVIKTSCLHLEHTPSSSWNSSKQRNYHKMQHV